MDEQVIINRVLIDMMVCMCDMIDTLTTADKSWQLNNIKTTLTHLKTDMMEANRHMLPVTPKPEQPLYGGREP